MLESKLRESGILNKLLHKFPSVSDASGCAPIAIELLITNANSLSATRRVFIVLVLVSIT